MTSSPTYKKLNAQGVLARTQLQGLLEQLISELLLSRPGDPMNYLITRLREMEALPEEAEAVAPGGESQLVDVVAPRKIVSVFGGPYSGKSAQCAMVRSSSVLVLSPSELLEEAASGRCDSKHGYNICIPEDLHLAVLDGMKRGVPASTAVLTRLFVNSVTQMEEAEERERAAAGDAKAKTVVVLDGYPRTIEQALALEAALGELSLVIQLYCPHHVLLQRMSVSGLPDGEQTRRWAVYRERVMPLEEFWKASKKLVVVDGSLSRVACGKIMEKLINT